MSGLPGRVGTIDLSGYDDRDYVLGGTITSNRSGTLQVTSILDEDGIQRINILLEDAARTQSVSSHREEELDLIEHLGEWGKEMDHQPGDPETGVSLYILREFFGDWVTIEGTLINRTVTLEIILGPHQDQ